MCVCVCVFVCVRACVCGRVCAILVGWLALVRWTGFGSIPSRVITMTAETASSQLGSEPGPDGRVIPLNFKVPLPLCTS